MKVDVHVGLWERVSGEGVRVRMGVSVGESMVLLLLLLLVVLVVDTGGHAVVVVNVYGG